MCLLLDSNCVSFYIMERPLSGCCSVQITDGTEYGSDKCSKCGKEISYGLLIPEWARWEACGVCEDFAGNLWFFWSMVSRWRDVQEFLNMGQQFVCQAARTINTIGCKFNRDGDLISPKYHKEFLDAYVSQVKNPEVVKLFNMPIELANCENWD
jgi:hypothetical protein